MKPKARTPFALAAPLFLFALAAAAPVHAQTARTLTEATLIDPSPTEWVAHGATYAEDRHSLLTRIDTTNIGQLGLAWSVRIGTVGKVETTPIVFDGVMYGSGGWSVLFAIDLRNRELKWRWDPGIVRGGLAAMGPRACCGPVNRGVAVYNGRVYAGLLDGRLVALDAETGQVAWAVQTTPPGSDYSITGAPRIVKGNVVIGNGGAEYGVRGYVTAYNAETGQQVWRFYTVPGNPADGFESPIMEMAARTWNGNWWHSGGGGTVWDGIAYDHEADLLYLATGNGSPWNRDYRSPGGGDNLFLASIVAVRGTTGEYVWHYQTTPGDHWDYNSAQSMILADLPVNGQTRKVIMQAPKNGFFYVLDRLTGEFISGTPYVVTTWATAIDEVTGRPIETPQARYGQTPVRLAPSFVGAHHWQPMAWSPDTRLAYFAGQQNEAVFQATASYDYELAEWNLGMRMSASRGGVPDQPPALDPPPIRRFGFIVGWDPLARAPRWRIELTPGGGVLSTAGGVVFASDTNRLLALHAGTGATLWQMPLYPGIATPITYEIDGQQYVSVLSGTQASRIFTFALGGAQTVPPQQ